ncbi:MAG TPA: iron ABC transporter permease [Vicinamibacterales bacterium]|nr:iron ABC transporter permease [Vicinamibacterales bacterium]
MHDRARDPRDPGPSSRLAGAWLAVMGTVLLAGSLLALTIGTYDIPVADLPGLLAPGPGDGGAGASVASAVVWNLRIPRILLAGLVGAALAASGAVFQASFRNPLVEPYILGVSSGAAFGAALGMVVPQFPLSVQLAAFLGALASVGLVHLLARSRGDAPIVTLVLSGVIVGSMFAAGVSLLKYFSDDTALREIVFWLMGGFYFASWRDVAIAGPVVLVATMAMMAGGWTLNVLSMGDHEAETLGVNPRRARPVLLAAATLATAVSVAAAGIVPWIGLMTPHAVRLLLGPDNRLVVPGSALLGAVMLLACDTAARSLTSSEIPVGIITALAGGPFLAYLVRQRTAGLFG